MGFPGPAHDLAVGLGGYGLLARLREQILEVRHPVAVIAAHGGDGGADADTGGLVPGGVDLLGASAHEALGTAQVAVDFGVEQLDEQHVQIRVDEPRLRQELLRRRLVVGHGVRWEVLVDLDASAFFVPTARVDRKALEMEEDFDLVLGDLDPQLLVAVDIRSAAVVSIYDYITVSVQRRVLSFSALELILRERL